VGRNNCQLVDPRKNLRHTPLRECLADIYSRHGAQPDVVDISLIISRSQYAVSQAGKSERQYFEETLVDTSIHALRLWVLIS
jgi:hypothetical protein